MAIRALDARTTRQPSPWFRVWIGGAATSAVAIVGTVGYVVLGLTWFEAVYQTVITITTVGYNEIGADEVDTPYRIWSLGVVLVGLFALLYTISMFVEVAIEENLNDRIRERRMQKRIDELDNHVVVAGWGRVGQAIGSFVERMGTGVVVIDRDPDVGSDGMLRLVGEATEDDMLRAAGIERARVLVSALPDDPANLYVTLSARAMVEDLFIVARTSSQAAEAKFFQAGASRVVNPHEIGGSRMAAIAMQPHVAEFFDEVLHDDTHDVAVLELTVSEDSRVCGNGITSLSQPGDDRALVVALRKHETHSYVANPRPDMLLEPNDVIIAVGSASELQALARLVGDRGAAADLTLGSG